MTIGERIAYIREYQGLTQQQFSQKIHISRSSLSEIEGGKYAPSYRILKNIVEMQDIEGTWLLTGTGPVFATTPELKKSGVSSVAEQEDLASQIIADLQSLTKKYVPLLTR